LILACDYCLLTGLHIEHCSVSRDLAAARANGYGRLVGVLIRVDAILTWL
jgi:hypothetical protein